jgi:hypothetical protein
MVNNSYIKELSAQTGKVVYLQKKRIKKMQTQIPIVPNSTKLINSNLGFFGKEGFV